MREGAEVQKACHRVLDRKARGLRNTGYRTTVFLSVAALLSGCAGAPSYLDETKYVDVTGANQLADRDVTENIDLGALLISYAPVSGRANCGYDPNVSLDGVVKAADGSTRYLESATKYFNCMVRSSGDKQAMQARNALQERILAASAQRCNAFKGNLQRAYSRVNFNLGLANTIAGTAGALVSGSAANYWSGASAIFSGARSEFNQDYMSGLAAFVITDGIDKFRRDAYKDIQQQGQNKPYADYPVEAAIKDALFYHGLCNVMSGFRAAHDAIKEVDNPGMNASVRMLAKLKVAQRIDKLGSETDLDKLLESAAKITAMDTLMAGSLLGSKSEPTPRPDQQWDAWAATVNNVDEGLKQAIAQFIDTAKTDEKLKNKKPSELGLEPNPATGQFADFKALACREKLKELQRNELKQMLDASDKTGADQAVLKYEAESTRRQIQAILDIANSMIGDYQAEARKSISDWQAAYAKAANDAAAFKNQVLKQPTFKKSAADQLKQMCATPPAAPKNGGPSAADPGATQDPGAKPAPAPAPAQGENTPPASHMPPKV